MSHEFDVRIAYADTDRMGVVYYANYFVLFERGRTELLRSIGIRFRDVEDQLKIFSPVMDARCQYRAPARYDDLIRVHTRIVEVGRAHLAFGYRIHHAETDAFLAQGLTKHPFVNEQWKVVSVPESLAAKLKAAQESPFSE